VSYEVTMPKLSDSMEEGKIIKWRKHEGDEVTEGDIIAEIESDKAVMELESFTAGRIEKILHGEEEVIRVGEPIALIAEKGPSGKVTAEKPVQAIEKEVEPTAAPAQESAPVKEEEEQPAAGTPREAAERVAASPLARSIAEEYGIELTQVKGSGPGGRIVKRDLERLAEAHKVRAAKDEAKPSVAQAPPRKEAAPGREQLPELLMSYYGVDRHEIAPTGTDGRLTVSDVLLHVLGESLPGAAAKAPEKAPQVRPSAAEELPKISFSEDEAEVEEVSFRQRAIIQRVTASKRAIPHFYVTRKADVSELVAQKGKLKKKFGATLSHLVTMACVKALKAFPQANWSYDRGKIIKWKGIHVGMAVQTESGLVVAVLRDAQDKSFEEIVRQSNELVDRARQGRLGPKERANATFTISSLGMYHVDEFAAIINPPSACTLAAASAIPTPIVSAGEIKIADVMSLTVSADHRIIDGVLAANLMGEITRLLEHPDELLS